MAFNHHNALFGFFVINTAALCGISILFGLDCTHFENKCNPSLEIITYIYVCSAVVYGVSSFLALCFWAFFSYQKIAISRLLGCLMTVSSVDVVFSVGAGICMLISLFFSFDPSSLDDDFSKVNFVFLWIVAVYAVATLAGTLLATIYLSNRQENVDAVIASEVYTVPAEINSISKVPIV